MKSICKLNTVFMGLLVLNLILLLYGSNNNIFANNTMEELRVNQSIAECNADIVRSYLHDDEYGGLYFDEEILVIMALTHPDDAHINSVEKISSLVSNNSRVNAGHVRIEEARFSISEIAMVLDYLTQYLLDYTVVEISSITNDNTVLIGLPYEIYDDEVLKKETIEYLSKGVSELTDKEDFGDILTFTRGGGIILYSDIDLLEYYGESWLDDYYWQY